MLKKHLRSVVCIVSLISAMPFIAAAQPIPAGQLSPSNQASTALTNPELEHHRLDIVPGPFGAGSIALRSGPWEHDPAHRHGVPYRNAVLAARYEKESEASRREFRGFSGLSATTQVPVVSHQATEVSPRGMPMRTVPPGVHRAATAIELSDKGARARGEVKRNAAGRPAPTSGPSSGSHGSEPPHH